MTARWVSSWATVSRHGIAVVARARAEERDAPPLGDGDRARRLRALVREARHRREREQVAHDDDPRGPRPVDAEIARERVARLRHGVDEERRERAVVLVLPEHLDSARLVAIDRQRGGDALAAARDVGQRFAARRALRPRGARGSPPRRRSRARRWRAARARAGPAGSSGVGRRERAPRLVVVEPRDQRLARASPRRPARATRPALRARARAPGTPSIRA